jgi:hypothetical protein
MRYSTLHTLAWVIFAVSLVAMVLPTVAMRLGWLSWDAGSTAFVAVVCVFSFAQGGVFWMKRRIASRVKDAGGWLCPDCLYPARPGSDKCSECGRLGTPADCQIYWEGVDVYHPLGKPPPRGLLESFRGLWRR